MGMAEKPMMDGSGRWTARRKAALIEAVVSGQMTVEEIGRRYAVSAEEFVAWSRDYVVRGLVGLQAKGFLARPQRTRTK
jgi:transposase-like protein